MQKTLRFNPKFRDHTARECSPQKYLWRIPWIEEPWRLLKLVEVSKVGRDWVFSFHFLLINETLLWFGRIVLMLNNTVKTKLFATIFLFCITKFFGTDSELCVWNYNIHNTEYVTVFFHLLWHFPQLAWLN